MVIDVPQTITDAVGPFAQVHLKSLVTLMDLIKKQASTQIKNVLFYKVNMAKGSWFYKVLRVVLWFWKM